jgi:HEPN domain-containing protein
MGEEEPIITHSVNQLLKAATVYESGFGALDKAKRLDDYYLPTRYPNALPGSIPAEYYDDPEEASEMEELAEAVLRIVEGKFGKQ